MKDKLFIFGDYLRTSDHEAIASTFTIPDSRYFTPTATPLPGCCDPAGCIDLSARDRTGRRANLRSHLGTPMERWLEEEQRPAHLHSPTTRFPTAWCKARFGGDAATAERGCRQIGTLSTKPSQQPGQQLHDATFRSPRPRTASTSKSDFSLTEKNHVSGRYSYQRVITFQRLLLGTFLADLLVVDLRAPEIRNPIARA